MNQICPFDPIRDWIFDLDHTLYAPDCGIFPQIRQRMSQFICHYLDMDQAMADRERTRLYETYGTTLSGLMTEYHLKPHDFLDFVHDIDLSVLTADQSLRAALQALPGRRFIYTNGSLHHAENVLQRLGIADLFGDIFDIQAARYISKPGAEPYHTMLATFAATPAQACMIEDMQRNLAPAKALGMRTVWIDPQADTASLPDHVDHHAPDLMGWLGGIAAVRKMGVV